MSRTGLCWILECGEIEGKFETFLVQKC
jgi:hypothetical protein